MAGETGTVGGSEFPVFKSSAGAFDRAKYEEQDKARIISDGINARSTGKEIDEDLVEKKKAVEQAASEAIKFYDDSYNKNIKELDPAIDTNSIFYREAYSGTDSDKKQIKRKLDKGETIDGKEIFEMSKKSATNKIGNAQLLKNGRVTEILENIGLKDVSNFDLYDSVRDDFNSKVKDEKFKFDPLLTKFEKILDYFNVKESSLASQYAPILYTPENMAILSALAKVLEAEGFDNESVKNSSKNYDENINKLVDKSKAGTVEDIRKLLPGATAATGPTGTTIENKLEEKKIESPTGPTGASVAPIESTTSSTGAMSTTGSTGPTTTTTTETITTVTTSTTGPTGSSAPGKVEGAKTPATSGTGATGVTTADVKKRQEDLLSSILGIKFEAATGETGGTGGTGGKKKEPEKKKEETSLEKKNQIVSPTGPTGPQNPTAENKETKLEEKISSNTPEKTETSSINTPIKETETQNLSSVITPESGGTGANQNTQTGQTNTGETNTTTSTQTKTAEVKTEGGGTNTTEEPAKTEDKAALEEKQKNDKEMAENMKSMVDLLTRLNNTLQNPLVVIPNNKKFQ